MLIGKFGISAGPATVVGRRPVSRLALLLALGLIAACATPPPDDWHGVREAAQRAIRLVRERHPEQARYLQTLLAHAEIAAAAEASAPVWRRSPGRAEAAWLRLASAAAKSVHDLRRNLAEEQSAYMAALEHATLAVQRAQQQIKETGLGRREAAAFARATASHAAALRLAELGDWQGARYSLNRAREAALLVHTAWSGLHGRFADPDLRRQWQMWANETITHSLRHNTTAIVVDKLNRRLDLYHGGVRVRSYPAELGANGLRRKQHSGDRATPEGMYHVVDLKSGHRTKYYKALLINYPNEEDRARFEAARRRGTIPWRVGIGNLIEIHGAGGQGTDWTDGCVALANQDMDEVFSESRPGTLVTIVGTYVR